MAPVAEKGVAKRRRDWNQKKETRISGWVSVRSWVVMVVAMIYQSARKCQAWTSCPHRHHASMMRRYHASAERRLWRSQFSKGLMGRSMTTTVLASHSGTLESLFPSRVDDNTPALSVMAPMVAASDYPFRCLCRQYGVQLTYTQMMHAKNLVRDKKFRRTHLDLMEIVAPEITSKEFSHASASNQLFNQDMWTPHQHRCLEGAKPYILPHSHYKFLQGPVMAQLAGSTVDSVLEAAAFVMEASRGKLTGIDLNLGCPQGIARKGNYGAFLCEQDFDGVCDILTSLSQWMQQHYPESLVSAKIRLPQTNDVLVKERIPRLVETGISFLTIHGRTLHENKTKVRACHIDRIRLAIETAHRLQPGFPVIANGGVETYRDVQQIPLDTGAVGVMSSEALLETPNVFQPDNLLAASPRQRLEQQLQFANDYLNWCTVCPPLPGVLGVHGSFYILRGHLFKFLHRYLQEQPDLREKLASHQLSTLQEVRELVQELEERYASMSDDQLEACQSAQPNASWYRRHRDARSKVHTRQFGGATSDGNNEEISRLSVEEKKALLRQRIEKLKQQRVLTHRECL